jgi:hypothetical protein
MVVRSAKNRATDLFFIGMRKRAKTLTKTAGSASEA